MDKSQLVGCELYPELAAKLHTDPAALESAAKSYGNIVSNKPAAVLYPSSVNNILSLVQSSYKCLVPFGIAVRGNGHSIQGQNMVSNGVVVNMKALREARKGSDGVKVSKDPLFADVGGEQLWIDVLNETIKHGLTPVSWVDYLELSVGGTLSNAGISGHTFLVGPQTSNVYEMDVITGKGELATCSADNNADLFYGVLGGLGQFGIITRARIALAPAPKRVKIVYLVYTDFLAFTKDQEALIGIITERKQRNAADYLEGQALMRSNSTLISVLPPEYITRIMSLFEQYGIIYCIELAKNYNDDPGLVDEVLDDLIKGLSFVPGFIPKNDVTYVDFLARLKVNDEHTHAHPWIDLFVPKSRISDFHSGIFKDIILKRNITTSLAFRVLINKWDKRMSIVTPDEDVFYSISFQNTSKLNEWQAYDDQNKAVIQFCNDAGLDVKEYRPYHATEEEWVHHFGSKWDTFRELKARFDPKMILSPGQQIFSNRKVFHGQ